MLANYNEWFIENTRISGGQLLEYSSLTLTNNYKVAQNNE